MTNIKIRKNEKNTLHHNKGNINNPCNTTTYYWYTIITYDDDF